MSGVSFDISAIHSLYINAASSWFCLLIELDIKKYKTTAITDINKEIKAFLYLSINFNKGINFMLLS